MTDKPRFQLLNVKVLTRLQQWIVGVATLVGLFGLALCLTGRFPLGILCLGLSAVTNGLINLSATRRLSISRRQGWWLVTALFAVSGLFSLVHALAPNNTDPYVQDSRHGAKVLARSKVDFGLRPQDEIDAG
jgi:hypothetical protein